MRPLPIFAASILTIVLVSPVRSSLSHTKVANGSTLNTIHSFTISQNGNEATVSVGGQVKTPQGRAIKGAYIVIRDAGTNQVVRTTYSSSFGYYRLDQIETGRSYVLSVTHRRYLFATAAQLLEINEERTGMDFVGEPDED